MASEFERLQAALPKRYTLLRELDRGGMSRVYLAREELPDRDVAIKVFDEQLSARLGRERFVREVEVTSQLGHPHIVPIHAAGDADGTLYYVMPFIREESLRDRLEREGRLGIEDALRVTEQVAGALGHAHEKGIVHRDVKPANILFQSGHAVVADFGIARALRAAEGRKDATHAGTTLGTPDYMSPEQIGADGEIDGRTDTYALACVLYEMLGGQPPFHSRTHQATFARQLTDTMPSLRALRDSVPRHVEDAIRKALSKAPADRYGSVGGFAKALRPSVPAGIPAAPAVQERSLLGPVDISLRLAAVLVLVGAIGFAWQAWSSSDPTPALAESPYLDSVAMMPLENRTGDATLDNLGQSLTDEVIGHLSEVPEVKVISRYSVVSLWQQNLGIPRLLDTLNVGHVITGYYELRAGELAVIVQEIDADDVVHPRTTYESISLESRDSAQIAIAYDIAESFLERLGLSAGFHLLVEDYGPGRDAHIAGNSWLGQRTPEGLRNAATRFTESIALDSTYAPPHAGLSSAYALAMLFYYDIGLNSYELAARALSSADRAVQLDPNYDGGYSSRGFIRGLLGMDVDSAQADFERALELAPNAPNGPSWSARILAQRGRFDDAYREAWRAVDLDPVNAGRRNALASLAFQMRDYDVVIEQARTALRLAPTLARPIAVEGRALALTGRWDECLSLAFDVYELVRALCLDGAGREQEGLDLAEAAEATLLSGELAYPGYLPELVAQDLTAYYGFVGNAAKATEWVRFAFDLSPAAVDTRILGSELMDPVRTDPDFATAVEEVWEQARARVMDERARLGAG